MPVEDNFSLALEINVNIGFNKIKHMCGAFYLFLQHVACLFIEYNSIKSNDVSST